MLISLYSLLTILKEYSGMLWDTTVVYIFMNGSWITACGLFLFIIILIGCAFSLSTISCVNASVYYCKATTGSVTVSDGSYIAGVDKWMYCVDVFRPLLFTIAAFLIFSHTVFPFSPNILITSAVIRSSHCTWICLAFNWLSQIYPCDCLLC